MEGSVDKNNEYWSSGKSQKIQPSYNQHITRALIVGGICDKALIMGAATRDDTYGVIFYYDFLKVQNKTAYNQDNLR